MCFRCIDSIWQGILPIKLKHRNHPLSTSLLINLIKIDMLEITLLRTCLSYWCIINRCSPNCSSNNKCIGVSTCNVTILIYSYTCSSCFRPRVHQRTSVPQFKRNVDIFSIIISRHITRCCGTVAAGLCCRKTDGLICH